jgi:hypothetical protein
MAFPVHLQPIAVDFFFPGFGYNKPPPAKWINREMKGGWRLFWTMWWLEVRECSSFRLPLFPISLPGIDTPNGSEESFLARRTHYIGTN